MARQPEEKRKASLNIRRLLPCFAAAFISYWLFELYMNRLSARLFTSAALTKPEIIGAAAPFSYRVVALIIVGTAVFAFPILLIDGFEKKPSKWVWIIACLLAIPQLHGKTCLYEDGRLVTSMPLGIVRCEHTLSEVTLAEIEVSGRSTVRTRHVPRRSSNLTLTLHIPCGSGEDVFTFSVESFSGEKENDQLHQMVSVRRTLPSGVIAVEPYTERELNQVLNDERLENANPALLKELLKAPQ